MASPTPQHPSPRGQSLVEFALIAPLLVALIVGIIELGILFSVYVGLTNSAREGARAGAIYQAGRTPTNGDAAAVAAIDAARRAYLSGVITDTLNPIIPATAITPTVVYLPSRTTTAERDANPLRAGDTISLTLEYRHRLLWGLFGERELVLRANSANRIEPGPGGAR